MTRIYLADTREYRDANVFREVYQSLPEYRRQKIDRLKFPEDQLLSLAAGDLLRTACRDYGIPGADGKIRISPEGKPDFTEALELHFSLSHSGTRAMCVISDRPAGCDTERIREIDPAIARRFFPEDDRALLRTLTEETDETDAFFRIWTLKESYLKCVGTGLALPMAQFSLRREDSFFSVAEDASVRLYTTGPRDGFRYAYCLKTSEGKE